LKLKIFLLVGLFAFSTGLVIHAIELPALEMKKEPEKYTVVQGDNLYRIALNHNISLKSLVSWNGIAEKLIQPGDELIVSGDEEKIEAIESELGRVAAVSLPVPVNHGKEMIVTATAYTAYCEGCSGTTASGIDLRSNPNQKVIAVDPKVIKLGTRVWVEGYGEAIAGDTGGAIKGKKIDVFIPSHGGAMKWGVQTVKIKVLD